MVSLIDGQKSDAIDAITTTADTTRSSLSAAEKRYRGTAAALQTFASAPQDTTAANAAISAAKDLAQGKPKPMNGDALKKIDSLSAIPYM